MGSTTHQKKKVQGEKISLFPGLAKDVSKMIKKIETVVDVSCANVRKYQGERKVKMSWGRQQPFFVTVCDPEYGERQLRVDAKKHGAVSRLLRKQLIAEGLYVPAGRFVPSSIAA